MIKILIIINAAWAPILIISSITTLIYYFVVISEYKLVKKEHYAFDYLKKDTLKMRRIKDLHIDTHVDKSEKHINK